MSRDEAAALLGVSLDASAAEIRRAWRTWARLAHPDAGGQPHHFDRLRAARDVLLGEPNHTVASTMATRLPWSAVTRAPSRREVIIGSVLVALSILLASLPAVLGVAREPLALAVTASPAAIAAAGCASVIVSRSLTIQADVGHRIVALTAAWMPIVFGQIVVAQIAGASLVPVLPVLALPFVASIAAVNPGAGLWVRRSR